MDSISQLQGSLPRSLNRQNAVLAPFRESARSLTALFKTASAEIDRAYVDGAREALEDLLSAMDNESLGLQEGEGWRVRQLVMNIYQSLRSEAPSASSASEAASTTVDNETHQSSTTQEEKSIPTEAAQPPAAEFTFTAPYPSDVSTQTPPLRPTTVGSWVIPNLDVLGPTIAKGDSSIGAVAGSKRRSISPFESSDASTPPTPKRARKTIADE